jgi:hypothetical protein
VGEIRQEFSFAPESALISGSWSVRYGGPANAELHLGFSSGSSTSIADCGVAANMNTVEVGIFRVGRDPWRQ